MPKRLKRGLVQVYTGAGKGKTTAAIGLALRAAGSGLTVYLHQFLKKSPCGETEALSRIRNIKVAGCGRGAFIRGRPKPEEIKCARDGLAAAGRMILSGRYSLVILDEVNVAMKLGLIRTEDVLDLIARKPKTVELVLTGRGCPAAVMKKADLVTEMRNIRHPFDKGIPARRGIEY